MTNTTPDALRRAILEQVASGELSPDEAVQRLSDAEQASGRERPDAGDGNADELPPAWADVPEPATGEGRAARIEVRAALRSVIVEGDGTVAEASPSGSHRAFREGDVLVISAEPTVDAAQGGFSFSYRTGRGLRTSKGGRPDLRPLRIRVNPDLPLEATLDAGSLAVRDVRAPIKLRVSAGSAKVEGLASPINAQVNAGSLSASGRLDHGDSVITCDAGSVKLNLERGSSVRMRLRTNLGKILLPNGSTAKGGPLDISQSSGMQVGDGAGTLDVSVNLGKISITSDEGTATVRHDD